MDAELAESEDSRAVVGPVSNVNREGVQMVLFSQIDEASGILLGNDHIT